MLNSFASSGEKYFVLSSYAVILLFMAIMAWFLIKIQHKTLFHKILIFISLISILVISVLLLQIFVPSTEINRFAIYLVTTTTIFCFLSASLGFIIYGVSAIITKQTYIKIFLIPKQTKGLSAVYFGVLFVIIGLIIILGLAAVLRLFICDNDLYLCHKLQFIEDSFSIMGNILIFLIKPLKFLGVV